MPPQPESYETVRRSLKRAFTQRGGAGPQFPTRYAGQNENFIEIDDLDNPVIGGITREQNHDPNRYGQYVTTAVITEPADFATNSVMFKEKRGQIPWIDYDPSCLFNIYEPNGFCKNPSDLIGGWETLQIYAGGRITGRSGQGNTSFEEDAGSIISADVTWTRGAYKIGSLGLGEVAAVEASREIIDVVYGASAACGDCGVYNDGTGWIYALQQDDNSSTGITASVLYSTDSGATWGTSAITGIGGNAAVTAIDVMGGYLVVLSNGDNAYYYSAINPLTGVPGTWTKVTSGFVALKTPNDLFVVSASEAYIAAAGGYVYRLNSPGNAVTPVLAGNAGTGNLLRIDGTGETFVAVGAGGLVVRSTNRGQTWAAVTTSPAATDLQAIDVVSPYLYWTGGANGNLYYTINGGESWVTKDFPGSGAGNIYDIVFPTFEVGYVAHATVTPTAKLLTTFDGGFNFANSADLGQQRIKGFPTFNKAGRIAVPSVGSLGVRANNLVIAGLGGGGTDGIILVGAPSVL